MAIKKMEHVGIVVNDLPAAIEFFVELGLESGGTGQVEGEWVDRGTELVGELVRYENSYRLCYVRGPEGIIIELAEKIS
jgi:catechol 2,3-dioxygenase-like lactoylglutathione lyase family enzyme